MKEQLVKRLISRAANPNTTGTPLVEIFQALIDEAIPEKKEEVRRLLDFTLAKGQENLTQLEPAFLMFCGEMTIGEDDGLQQKLQKSEVYNEFLSKRVH